MFFKKLRPKKRKAKVAADAMSGSVITDALTAAPPAATLVAGQHTERRRDGHLGMQGYAPSVRVSKNRRYCEYCSERVVPAIRHVCWGNVEHHVHTLLPEERARIMAQLASKPKKPTRAQLKKLYSSDGMGPAEY